MNRVIVYVLEVGTERTLVYGYATPASTRERPGQRDLSPGGRWRLRRYAVTLDPTELDGWCATLAEPRIRLPGTWQTIIVDTGGLRQRPPVYALPRQSLGRSSPRSFGDRFAIIDSYWQLDKRLLFAAFRGMVDP
jgi:hypothetical protein